jgi:hypothetical protein
VSGGAEHLEGGTGKIDKLGPFQEFLIHSRTHFNVDAVLFTAYLTVNCDKRLSKHTLV